MTRLRVLLAFGAYRVGDVITVTGLLRDHLLGRRWYGRRLVELVADVAPPPAPAPEPQPAAVPEPASRKKKGKP